MLRGVRRPRSFKLHLPKIDASGPVARGPRPRIYDARTHARAPPSGVCATPARCTPLPTATHRLVATHTHSTVPRPPRCTTLGACAPVDTRRGSRRIAITTAHTTHVTPSVHRRASQATRARAHTPHTHSFSLRPLTTLSALARHAIATPTPPHAHPARATADAPAHRTYRAGSSISPGSRCVCLLYIRLCIARGRGRGGRKTGR